MIKGCFGDAEGLCVTVETSLGYILGKGKVGNE